jgi:hypothetical protein
MAEFTNNLKNAPLNRLSAKAKELSGQEVPVEAAPVTSLSGSDPGLDPETGATAGMQGNYADLVARAKSLPIEDQQPYLDQLKRQFGADTETAQAGILGKTRKRTADESLQAAADYAKVNDLSAYADYESRIGKPLRDEKRVGILDKRAEDSAAASERNAKNQAAETQRKERHDADWKEAQDAKQETADKRLEAILKEKDASKRDEKVMDLMEGRRKEIAADSNEITKQMAGDLKNAEFGTPEEKAKIKASYQGRLNEIAKARKQMDADFAHLRSRFDLPDIPAESPSTSPSANPAARSSPYAEGTKLTGPGGKPYIVKNGIPVPQ